MTRFVRSFAAVMVVACLLAPSAAAVGATDDRVRYTGSETGGKLAIDTSGYRNHGKMLAESSAAMAHTSSIDCPETIGTTASARRPHAPSTRGWPDSRTALA